MTKEALQQGMIYIKDTSGTNIDVQIFDTAKLDFSKTDLEISERLDNLKNPLYLLWIMRLENKLMKPWMSF